MKFSASNELVTWYQKLQTVVSKEIHVDSYITRMRMQDEKVSNLNKQTQYTKIMQDIEDKLLEIKKLCVLKNRFEKDNQRDDELVE